VVIMFELTGALTYILPTMIVLLVTKAVGDFLNVRGIADEMIRFNGFPFLEKEDHSFNVSVLRVMTSDLHTLSVSGLTVADLERILVDTKVQGYPIVSPGSARTLVGYIGRGELRYVIDKAQQMRRVSLQTPCSFAPGMNETGHFDDLGITSAPAVGLDEDSAADIIRDTASDHVLKFWPWVNQTPITVSPQLSLEITMQMFKRLGPRVILVEDRGTLVGLVTVKDVLRFTMTEKQESESWDDRGGFDAVLEEVWTWVIQVEGAVVSWYRRIFRR